MLASDGESVVSTAVLGSVVTLEDAPSGEQGDGTMQANVPLLLPGHDSRIWLCTLFTIDASSSRVIKFGM